MGVMRKSDPLTWQDVDGIILNEVPPAPNVAGVAANIGILVGQSQRGLAALTELTSLNMAQETFGKDKTSGLYKVLKNKTFGRLKFIRVVASDAVMATKSFASSTVDRIKFDAKGGKGAFGNNIQVKIEDGTIQGKKYTIQDTNTDAVLGSETYDNVIITEITASTFSKSKLVNVTVLSTAEEPTNAAFTSLAGGSNGTVVDTDYEDAIAIAEQEGAGNVLFLDSYNTVRNGYLKTHAALTNNKMVIVEGASDNDDADAIADVPTYRDTDGRIIYAFNPAITVIDGLEVEQPAAWWIASLFTQVAPHIDLAYGPNAQYLAGITKLKYNLSLTSYTLLNKAGICTLEFDPDMGHKVKSAVVTQVLNTEKVTILRRRMTDFLQDSLAAYLKNFGNAVNSKANRGLVKAGITRWDDQLIASGVLPGDSEMLDGGKARLIDTESLNDDDSIGQGLFKILYKRRIFSSMRYIVLSTEIGTGVVVEEVA